MLQILLQNVTEFVDINETQRYNELQQQNAST